MDVHRRLRDHVVIGAAVIALGIMLIADMTVAQTEPDVFYACTKGGVVQGRIFVNNQPECGQNQTLTSWNAEGPEGPQGQSGILSTYVASSGFASGPRTATCDEGDVLLGGGFEVISGATGTHAQYSKPTEAGDGWTTKGNQQLEAFAICGVTP